MQETDTESGNSESTALVLLNTRNIGSYMTIEQMSKAPTKIWGNQFAFLHLQIPKSIDDKCSDPIEYVYEARKQITRLKNSPSVYLTAHCLELLRKCREPEAGAELIHSTTNKASILMTNLISPIEQVKLANHPIKGIHFMVTGCPQSLLLTIMSYMKIVRIELGVEKGFTDSQRLESCIKNAFELTYEAATKSE